MIKSNVVDSLNNNTILTNNDQKKEINVIPRLQNYEVTNVGGVEFRRSQKIMSGLCARNAQFTTSGDNKSVY